MAYFDPNDPDSAAYGAQPPVQVLSPQVAQMSPVPDLTNGMGSPYGEGVPLPAPQSAPSFYGASPSAQHVQDLQQQIGQVYGNIPARNLPGERRATLFSGLAGVLLGGLAGNAQLGADAGASAAQGAQQGAQNAYMRQVQMAQWRAQQLMAQQNIAARMAGPEARYAASVYHTNAMQQNAGAGQAAALTRSLIAGRNAYVTQLQNDTTLTPQQRGEALNQYDARIATGTSGQSPYDPAQRVSQYVDPTQGTTPASVDQQGNPVPGQAWKTNPATGDMDAVDAQGNPTDAMVRSNLSPNLAAARPPKIAETEPYLPASPTIPLKQAAAWNAYTKDLSALTPTAQKAQLQMDAKNGRLAAMGVDPASLPTDAHGNITLNLQKAPPLKAAPTSQELQQQRFQRLATEREQLMQQAKDPRTTDATIDQINGRLAQIDSVLNPGATPVKLGYNAMSPAEAAASAARRAGLIIQQQNANSIAQNARTNAARLNLEDKRFVQSQLGKSLDLTGMPTNQLLQNYSKSTQVQGDPIYGTQRDATGKVIGQGIVGYKALPGSQGSRAVLRQLYTSEMIRRGLIPKQSSGMTDGAISASPSGTQAVAPSSSNFDFGSSAGSPLTTGGNTTTTGSATPTAIPAYRSRTGGIGAIDLSSPKPQPAKQSGPQAGAVPQIQNAKDYAAIKSGTYYIDPSGVRRQKP